MPYMSPRAACEAGIASCCRSPGYTLTQPPLDLNLQWVGAIRVPTRAGAPASVCHVQPCLPSEGAAISGVLLLFFITQ